MKILFDQGVPAPLADSLPAHAVFTAYKMGWSTLKNGELIRSAEEEGFKVFVTTDTNLKYQQNLSDRKIAIVVLLSTSWPRIQHRIAEISTSIDGINPGAFVEVAI